MDRRKSLQTIAIGAVGAAAALEACNPSKDLSPSSAGAFDAKKFSLDRAAPELERENKLLSSTFFTAEEMATINVLVDIIIPKDEVSGSATEAEVPAFLEFIVKDMPNHQDPMRGGLRWLELYSHKKFGKGFVACSEKERIEIVEAIAYPGKAAKEVKQGVAFFSLMRNLTVTGFYTSKIGIADLGYKGNQPNKWNGVPADVLAQYKLSYTEKELKECINFDEEQNGKN